MTVEALEVRGALWTWRPSEGSWGGALPSIVFVNEKISKKRTLKKSSINLRL